MSGVKTAISVPKTVFEQLDKLSREIGVSRSHLVAIALEEFIRHHQSRRLLAELNAAYEEGPDPSERTLRAAMRRQHREIVDGEW